MKPKRVVVEWEDCYVLDNGPWAEKETDFKWVPYVVESTGFLLYEGPEGVVITDSWTDKDHTGTRQQIPRGMIRKLRVESQRKRKTNAGSEVRARPEAKAVGD